MPIKSKDRIDLADALVAMGRDYRADPVKAVRSQGFINHLHDYLADDLDSRLTKWARKSRGVYVKKEAKLLGVAKDKNVDVAVIDPQNGPLLIIGARSQMSSIGNNVPGYFEGVIGDAMALEERFPMSHQGWQGDGEAQSRALRSDVCVDYRSQWHQLPHRPRRVRPVRVHGRGLHDRARRA